MEPVLPSPPSIYHKKDERDSINEEIEMMLTHGEEEDDNDPSNLVKDIWRELSRLIEETMPETEKAWTIARRNRRLFRF